LQSSLAEMLRTDIGQSAQLRTVPSDRVLQILSDLKLDPATNLDPATLRRLADHSNAQLVLSGTFTKLGDRIRIDTTLYDVEKNESTPVTTQTADEVQLLASIGRLAQSVRESLDLSADAIRELEATSFSPSSDSLDALRAYNNGLQLERQGNYLEALESFKTSVQIDQRFALAHAKLGQVFTSLGRDAEGERASRTAVELSEELPEYERHLIQASHAMILNDHAQALAAYQRLAEAAPADPQINFSLADLHEQAGDFDRARERLERVLGSDPNYVDALYAMGRVQIRSGNPQAALDSLNRALMLTVQAENEDGRGRVLNAIGIAYKRLDRPDEALRYYQESLEIRRRLDQKSGIAASLNEIADVQGTLGNVDEARASLEAALELLQGIGDRTGIGESLIGLGTFHHQLGQYDTALDYYKDSLQIQREIGNTMDEALCLNNIGVVYLERGEFGDALTNFEQSLRLREESGAVYELGETLFNLGETASALGRFGQALDHYLRALEQMRTSQDDLGVTAALHGIGVILGQQGRFRASLESLEEAMQTLEASGEKGYWQVVVTARYGAALNAVGRFDQARAVLETASGLAADLGNPSLVAQVLDTQGLGLIYQNNPEQAASRFRAAVDRAAAADDRKNALGSRLHLAETALRQDRPDDALGDLQEVAREAEDLGLKYVALASVVRLGEALLAQGEAQAAERQLRGSLSDLERGELRLLLADCHALLARIEQAGGDADGAARHRRQGRRILDEIREEAGDEDPFRRQDLQAIEAAVSDD
jgi:tetratricopeptide (TPR) repeat protein